MLARSCMARGYQRVVSTPQYFLRFVWRTVSTWSAYSSRAKCGMLDADRKKQLDVCIVTCTISYGMDRGTSQPVTCLF